MLIIRRAQMETLRETSLSQFEDQMVMHLARFSPPLFKAIGDQQLRVAVRFGTQKAGTYGLSFRGPVRLYLELMLLFGSHFDTDPQYPWATAILRAGDAGDQMRRAALLHEQTIDYRNEVVGLEDSYTLTALRKIAALAAQSPQAVWDGFIPVMVREITRVYPEKAAYLGRNALERLIGEGVAAARRFGLSAAGDAALFVVLMLAFGHGCVEDPLYPWIGRTLTDEAIVDSESRAKRLERKALVWLAHVLAYFEGRSDT